MAKELLPNDTEFKTWISHVKRQVRGAQIKASIAVNEEMLEFYWNIGKDISERNFEKSYGSKVFEKTSLELKKEFPDAQGFSERNLRYMKRFYMFYTEKLHQVGAESRQIQHQLGDEFKDTLFTIPWRHHIEIFTRAKSIDEALFFISKTKENGWSCAMLINMMDTKLFETRGNTINNFALTLPENESECAKEILKDEYKFDLLFFHLKLRCYIVVELKVVKFQPEFVSKLNFYCNAVNHMMKDKTDKNTIGLLICKEKNDVVAQWTVENLSEPIGISTYSLKKVLPSEEEIQKTLTKDENNGAEK